MSDMADPAPAIQACNQLISTLCTKWSTCPGGVPVDQCVATESSTVNCSAAIGYTLGYEKCMADIQANDCNTASFPATCDGVVKAMR